MRISALTLLLFVSAATAVTAAPTREETTERISYSGRTRSPVKPGDQPTDGWIELASPTPASHGRELIEVGASAGAFTQLRLTATSGTPRIDAVRVEYRDGRRWTFEVGKVLGAKRRPAYLDLHGAHEISEIVVIADRGSRGSYVLEGNAGATGVAMR